MFSCCCFPINCLTRRRYKRDEETNSAMSDKINSFNQQAGQSYISHKKAETNNFELGNESKWRNEEIISYLPNHTNLCPHTYSKHSTNSVMLVRQSDSSSCDFVGNADCEKCGDMLSFYTNPGGLLEAVASPRRLISASTQRTQSTASVQETQLIQPSYIDPFNLPSSNHLSMSHVTEDEHIKLPFMAELKKELQRFGPNIRSKLKPTVMTDHKKPLK